MIRIIFALCTAAFALVSVSCCCTGESGAPRLRPLTKFKEIETVAPAPVEVIYEK
jgi:hypothetical protein